MKVKRKASKTGRVVLPLPWSKYLFPYFTALLPSLLLMREVAVHINVWLFRMPFLECNYLNVITLLSVYVCLSH